jgi:hypothetical protein
METSNCWPDQRNCSILNAEWDMVENGIRSWAGPSGYAKVNHVGALHRNTGGPCGVPDTPLRSYDVQGLSGLCDWHVWSGKWTADEVTTYLDGQRLGSQPTHDTTAQPMYMLLTAAPTNSQPPENPPRPESMETQIDWVRVWQK